MSTQQESVGVDRQRLSVGRQVHYKAYGTPGGEYPSGVCRAATVTEVENDACVGLCIMNPTGLFFTRSVVQGDKAGQWHWPERV